MWRVEWGTGRRCGWPKVLDTGFDIEKTRRLTVTHEGRIMQTVASIQIAFHDVIYIFHVHAIMLDRFGRASVENLAAVIKVSLFCHGHRPNADCVAFGRRATCTGIVPAGPATVLPTSTCL